MAKEDSLLQQPGLDERCVGIGEGGLIGGVTVAGGHRRYVRALVGGTPHGWRLTKR